MTFGFDFDQLEEEDGTEKGDQTDVPEAKVDDEGLLGSGSYWEVLRLRELAANSSSTKRTLPNEVRLGSRGRALGLCLSCQKCRGWAPSTGSTAAPSPQEEVNPAEAETQPQRLEARGHCLPSLASAMPTFDGSRFVWPFRCTAGRTEVFAPAGSCARCGCPESRHEDVQAKLGRFLVDPGSVPLEALRWSHVEIALWGDTGGLFQPGGRRAYCPDEQKPGVLVSVICPTTSSRSFFHPFLWHCFEKQDHTPRELVVIDTNEDGPSSFLEEKASSDQRLLYKHFRVPEKQWSIGLKRNLACYFAAGEVIAHMDDDDMYAPTYISVMLKCLRDPKEAFIFRHNFLGNKASDYELSEMYHALNLEEAATGLRVVELSEEAKFWNQVLLRGSWGAAVAKLCSWFSFTIQDRCWCHCDSTDSEVPFTKESRHGIYGWGFSFVYLRLAWEAIPFLHINLGEDLEFIQCFRQLQLPLVLVPDKKGICAHTQHLENISGTCVKGGSRGCTPSSLLYSPLAPVLSWYEITAQGFSEYQRSKKEGKELKALPLLIPSSPLGPEQKEKPKSRSWMPGMKRTKEAVLAMMWDFTAAFVEETFQCRLHDSWHFFADSPRQREVERRALCLEVQGPVLVRWGFESSSRGLFQCSTECNMPDEEIYIFDRFLHWLTHPGDKVWQFLWPLLHTVRTDRTMDTLRKVFRSATEALREVEQEPGTQPPAEE